MLGKPNRELEEGRELPSTIELLTIRDVAALLKVSVTSVRRLQHGRHIPFIKVGGSVRFTKADIIAYLQKGRIEVIE
jgi:excisionase family DNA binding protein